MLPSSDEEDEEATSEEVQLLPAGSLHSSRHRWMRRIMSMSEEYCVFLIMPALCMCAVYALTMDWYATETFVLSTNSSLLLQPSPFLVNAVEIQVVSEKAGPVLYGFTASPQLGSEASWSELHDMIVAPDQLESIQAFAFWLNKGSFLNVTCSIKQTGGGNVLVRILQEHKSTSDWIQDFKQKSQLQCNQATDGTFQYRVPRDGNYSLVVDNLDTQSMEVLLGLQVLATLYNTDTAVYLCIPFPKACQLQFSLFGNRAAVLSTPNYHQSNFWKVKLSYKVRWFALATALGCVFFIASTMFKLASQLHSRHGRGDQNRGQDEECDWGDYDEINGADDTCNSAFCVVCLDACKNSFFIPCGHSATCLPCGLRLKNEEGQACPVCKEPIEMVNQMFHA